MMKVMITTWSARSTNEPSGKGFPSLLQEITGGGCPSPYNNIIMVLILWVLMVIMMMVMAVWILSWVIRIKAVRWMIWDVCHPTTDSNFNPIDHRYHHSRWIWWHWLLWWWQCWQKRLRYHYTLHWIINDGAELIHADVTLQTKASSSPCLSFSFPESTPRIWTDAGTG